MENSGNKECHLECVIGKSELPVLCSKAGRTHGHNDGLLKNYSVGYKWGNEAVSHFS